jgi:glycosyltransferase involved in cell wall biosynthesis
VRTRHIVQPIRAHALNRWLYGRATDLLVTVSDAIARQCVAGGLAPAHRVVAMPGGANGERFRPTTDSVSLRQKLGVDAGVPMIGMVSGFRIMKGHAVVVEAIRRLGTDGRQFHLVLAGQGPFEAVARQAVEAAGLAKRVSFPGFVDDTATLLAGLDIALYPPLESDGMSRALFEYLAAGRAVVASRVGLAAEVLTDGRDALLVPGGEAGELASAIDTLLDRASLRKELGESAARLAHAQFTSARVAERLLDRYRDLLAERLDGAPTRPGGEGRGAPAAP